MTIYLVIFSTLVLFSYLYDGKENDDMHKKLWYWFMCVCLTLVSGFSYGLGGDKFVYMDDFERIDTSMSYSEYIYFCILFKGHMPLWSMLNMWIKSIGGSFYLVQLIQAAIVNVGLCYIAKKYTKRIFLFLMVYLLWYFLIFNTEQMREALAVSICMIGMDAYMNKKKALFFVCLFIGCLFHISALIVLLFPFIRFSINWKTFAVAVSFSFLFWAVSDVLLGKLFLMVLGSVGTLADKVMSYSTQASSIFGYFRSLFDYVVFPYIIAYFSVLWEKDEKTKIRKEKVYSFLLILACIAVSLAGFRRFRNYAALFYLIAFADFIYMLFQTREHLLIRCGVLLGTLFLILLDYMVYLPATRTCFYEYYVPYTCILNENPKEVAYRIEMHYETAQPVASDSNKRNIKE